MTPRRPVAGAKRKPRSKEVNDAAAAKARATKGAHAQFVRSIVALAKLRGCFASESDSEGVFVGGHVRPARICPGFPDVLVIVPPTGRYMGLEAKLLGGKSRKGQRECHDKILANGGAVFEVHSMREADEAIRLIMDSEKRKAAPPAADTEGRAA